ncbi:hypothetical protein CHS0354_025460 [Potamilus streckersoni]|uniref:Uncharacterized protein n=1 Tax=Potamilus streckersoni TaxID=2493646 RepID=A0AAE0RRJ6_9BIVA|nr:hypothetical protein CHS0354_025460 [Potamilus streckersoni]
MANVTTVRVMSNETGSVINPFTGNTTKISGEMTNGGETSLTSTTPTGIVLLQEGLGTAEKVVIGAAGLVGVLAILAVVLRFLMPAVRKKIRSSKEKENKASGLSSYQNLGMDTSSQSSGSTGSSQEWLEISSNETHTTYYEQDKMTPKLASLASVASFGNLKGSTLSLPITLPRDSSSSERSTPLSARKLNQELVFALSSNLYDDKLIDDIYSQRWEEQWARENGADISSVHSNIKITLTPASSTTTIAEVRQKRISPYASKENLSVISQTNPKEFSRHSLANIL